MDEDGERSSSRSDDVSDECEMITPEEAVSKRQKSSQSPSQTLQSQSQSQQSQPDGGGGDEAGGDTKPETNGGEAVGSQPKRPKEVGGFVIILTAVSHFDFM